MTLKDFYPRFYTLHFLTILILEKEPVFHFPFFNVECQTRELPGTIFITSGVSTVLDWGLNPGPPALEASTLPLGYRESGLHSNRVLLLNLPSGQTKSDLNNESILKATAKITVKLIVRDSK